MSTAREAALAALQKWRTNDAWSDAAIHAAIERAELSPRDAALASRLCYGTLQNLALLIWGATPVIFSSVVPPNPP